MPDYSHVFTPITIRDIEFRNRIIFPAVQFNWAEEEGYVSDKLETYYESLAKGGCQLIICGGASVSYDSFSRIFNRMLRIDHDKFINRLSRLFSRIKEYGSIPAIQLFHVGRQGFRNQDDPILIAPSNIEVPLLKMMNPHYKIREMNQDDIDRVQDDFCKAAKRAVDAGAQAIEILVGMGYLLGQFLSPYSNTRQDNYGGSVENRVRFTSEIIQKIRETVDRKILIGIRISVNEFVPGGLEVQDYKEILPLLEKVDIDLVNVTVSTYEKISRFIPTQKDPPYIDYAEEIKRYTSLPVCANGGINDLSMADQILKDRKADFTVLCRALIADPYLVKKSRLSNELDIVTCRKCNGCSYPILREQWLHCRVNINYQRGEV